MAIIEAVLFNNELELLDARFHEGDGFVDQWVIIESPVTFTGEPKPLHFNEAASLGRFRNYMDRVLHVVAEPEEIDDDPWEREATQRDALLSVLSEFDDDDLVVLSDGDELTRQYAWTEILRGTAEGESLSLHKPTWYYTLTWALPDTGPDVTSYRSKAARVSTLRQYGKPSEWADDLSFPVVENSGWHLSCMGGPARLLDKLLSFSHQELNDDAIPTYEYCARLIQSGIDCVPTRNATLAKTPPTGPDWLLKVGVTMYPWLLTGEDSCIQPS
jgi:beta-1,4-mannosyl-glycoprotein beta-1,4-N-acetylglucosaminyltransferase